MWSRRESLSVATTKYKYKSGEAWNTNQTELRFLKMFIAKGGIFQIHLQQEVERKYHSPTPPNQVDFLSSLP